MRKPGSTDPTGKSTPLRKVAMAGGRRGGKRNAPLDPDVQRWFDVARSTFPASHSSVIPMLQSAQSALGYLPPDAMKAIARHLAMPPAEVEGVASFYAQFRFHKPGRHRLTVCSGTACYVRGSGKLMDDLQADLKVAPGATTADGAITLESVSCFGACALAPVVVLDDKVLRQQTSASMRQTIRQLGEEPAKPSSGDAPGPGAEEGARK